MMCLSKLLICNAQEELAAAEKAPLDPTKPDMAEVRLQHLDA